MPNYTLLLIDYEPRSIERMRRPLEQYGIRVEVATDGVAGLTAFERLQPDAVIVEAMLPKRHGFEVCHEIKKTAHGKRTPVIVTTGVYKGRRYRTQAMHIHGADEYLEKPLTDDQIVSTVRRLLSERPERPEPAPAAAAFTPTAPRSEPPAIETDHADIFEIVDESLSLPRSSTPAAPESRAPIPARRTSVVDDLTEDEISARLDALLPSDPTMSTEVSWEAGNAVGHLDSAASPAQTPVAVEVADAPEPIEDVVQEILSDFPPVPDVGALPEDIPVDPRAVDLPSTPSEGLVVPFDPDRTSRRKDSPGAGSSPPRAVGTAAVAPVVQLAELPVAPSVPRVEIPLTESYEAPKRGLPWWIWVAILAGLASGGYFAYSRFQPTEVVSTPASSPVIPSPVAVPTTREPAASALAAEPVAAPTSGPASVPVPAASLPRPAVDPPKPAAAPPKPPSATASSAPTGPSAIPTIKEFRGAPAQSPSPVQSPSENLEDPSLASVPVAPVIPAPAPARVAAQRGDLVSINEVDSPPISIDKPAPQYTSLGRTRRQQGTVVMEVLVDETGRVADVRLVRGIEGSDLNQAAMQAARSWVYRPAEKDGVPVRVWRPEQVRFKL